MSASRPRLRQDARFGIIRDCGWHTACTLVAESMGNPALAKDATEAPPAIEYLKAQGAHTLAFHGSLTLRDAGELWSALRSKVHELPRGAEVDLDMTDVEIVDGGTMALLVGQRSHLAARGVRAEFVNARENVQALIHLYAGDQQVRPRGLRRRASEGFLAEVGRATSEVGQQVKGVFGFLGDFIVAAGGVFRRPHTGNWRELAPNVERAGVNAVPIVLLINFLVGFVLAFQAAAQLERFGANIFVADLVGKSVTREMGPLMTAIILCGRSGAAFAAELGTMKVSEEMDALRTMGFSPLRFLVMPRTLALVIALPILTLLAEAAALAGGAFVAVTSLDLTFGAYISQLSKVLTAWDVFSGLVKSAVFAVAIALISCQQGFAASGGAEGVGRRTTSSVVANLVALILIDALFVLFFYAYGL